MRNSSNSYALRFAIIAAGTCAFCGCELKNSPRQLATAARLDVHLVSAASAPNSRKAVDPNTGATIYLALPAIITSAEVATVQRSEDSPDSPALSVNLTPAGATKLAAATTPAASQQLAVVVNGNVVAIASVMSPMSNKFQISGGAVQEDREQIIEALTQD